MYIQYGVEAHTHTYTYTATADEWRIACYAFNDSDRYHRMFLIWLARNDMTYTPRNVAALEEQFEESEFYEEQVAIMLWDDS